MRWMALREGAMWMPLEDGFEFAVLDNDGGVSKSVRRHGGGGDGASKHQKNSGGWRRALINYVLKVLAALACGALLGTALCP